MIPIIILTLTGVVLAIAIGLVAKYYGVEQDPRTERLQNLLPGANCGGCGFAGCADYAKAVVEGTAKLGLCASMSQAVLAEAAKLLGVEAGEKAERKVAVVCCHGDDTVASTRAFYNGVTDCVNATMVANGGKSCTYGCLGLGTCARVCPFNAIELVNHIAVIHADICMGCGKCVAVCPRNVIKLVPAKASVHVFCNSPESFKLKKNACKAGCIGCRKCAKSCDEGQITFNGFLATINYDNPPGEAVADVCPMHTIGKTIK